MSASRGPRALVLTAGLGTRLHPLTYVRAKAAVPVNGDPLVRRVIRWLAGHFVTDLVLNLHHHPASITSRVGDGSDMGARVRYSWEQPVLGSAGGPRYALPLLAEDEDETFLLVNGDTLTDLNPRDVVDAHRSSGALVTMALIPNPRPDKYGGVRVTDQQWVSGFTRAGSDEPSFHFIGVQAAVPRAFAGVQLGVPAESVNWLYPQLMRDHPHSVGAFVCDAAFQDIGTPADCLQTSLALAVAEGDRLISPTASVHASARVEKTALWDYVTVGPDAHLIECIVADDVRIPAGARYERSAIVTASDRLPQLNERLVDGLLIRPL